MKKKYLVKDKLSFDMSVCHEVGATAATVLDKIAQWVIYNANSESKKHYHEGVYWTYGSAKFWSEQLWCFSEDQIKRAIKKLIDYEYIRSGCYNSAGYDRTRWYTLTEKSEKIYLLSGDEVPEEHRTRPRAAQSRAKADEISDDVKIFLETWNRQPGLVPISEKTLTWGRLNNIKQHITKFGVSDLCRMVEIYATDRGGWYAQQDSTNNLSWFLGISKSGTGEANIERFAGLLIQEQRTAEHTTKKEASMTWQERLAEYGVTGGINGFDSILWQDVKNDFSEEEQKKIEKIFLKK